MELAKGEWGRESGKNARNTASRTVLTGSRGCGVGAQEPYVQLYVLPCVLPQNFPAKKARQLDVCSFSEFSFVPLSGLNS